MVHGCTRKVLENASVDDCEIMQPCLSLGLQVLRYFFVTLCPVNKNKKGAVMC